MTQRTVIWLWTFGITPFPNFFRVRCEFWTFSTVFLLALHGSLTTACCAARDCPCFVHMAVSDCIWPVWQSWPPADDELCLQWTFIRHVVAEWLEDLLQLPQGMDGWPNTYCISGAPEDCSCLGSNDYVFPRSQEQDEMLDIQAITDKAEFRACLVHIELVRLSVHFATQK